MTNRMSDEKRAEKMTARITRWTELGKLDKGSLVMIAQQKAKVTNSYAQWMKTPKSDIIAYIVDAELPLR